MITITLAELGLAVCCYLAYRIAYVIWRNQRFKNFAKANGCEEPFDISAGWGPWPLKALEGMDRLRKIVNMKSTGADILDDIFSELFDPAKTTLSTGFEGSVSLATIEPANLQAMLATQFKDFQIGQMRVNQFYPLLGKSIFSSDGAFWEHSRAMFRPQFNREQINDLEDTEEASQALIEAIGACDANGWSNAVALQPLLFNFTLDTATAFLFGESVRSQSIAIKEAAGLNTPTDEFASQKQFMSDFETASKVMIERIRYQTLYRIADGLQFRKAINRIRKFTDIFVQRALNPAAREKQASKKYNLLSALVEQTQDHTELQNQTLAILVAGRDTTSGLLGWCFARLAIHEDVFAKLRSVIMKDFPSTEQITFAKLKGCRYLQHFLNEVLRLHPNVPVNNRVAARDTTLPVGGGKDGKSPVAVPEGQTVVFSVYLMHRRKDLWGEDALLFKPERWEERIPAWQFLPFSGGPRICLGQQFALIEASYVIVRVLQHFDAIEAVDRVEMARLNKAVGLTMWPADQVRIRLHRAS